MDRDGQAEKRSPSLGDDADPINPDSDELKHYTRLKHQIAACLNGVRETFRILRNESAEAECKELMAKLAEDHFTLAVLGQFKRGKSSLMNAVLGQELLPTGILPLTSALTILRYGPRERLIVYRKDGLFPEEAPVSALPEFVTEKGNPSNEKGVIKAYLEVPLPFLRRGLEFVDTPGVGSAIKSSTVIAYDFLPSCDAVIFVTSVESPFSTIEIDLLREIRHYIRKIFFVVNKIDLVGEGARKEVVRFMINSLTDATRELDIHVYPLSAFQGLKAKQEGNLEAYARSGLEAFENELAHFLSREKPHTFLAALLDKSMALVARGLRVLGNNKADAESKRLINLLEVLKEIRNSMGAVTSEVNGLSTLDIATEEDTVSSLEVVETFPDVTREEFHKDGCPLCNRLSKVAADFFVKWQYELYSNEQVQKSFARSLGFCPVHTWQLAAVSSPQGICHGFPPLFEYLSSLLRTRAETDNPSKQVKSLWQKPKKCPACVALKQAEKEYVQKFATALESRAIQDSYKGCRGFCLRHLGMVLTDLKSPQFGHFLLKETIHKWDELAEDLQTAALKHEAVRRALQNESEAEAHLRALICLAGAKNLFFPWSSMDD
jgi:ribosome biogenesis GTPase A